MRIEGLTAVVRYARPASGFPVAGWDLCFPRSQKRDLGHPAPGHIPRATWSNLRIWSILRLRSADTVCRMIAEGISSESYSCLAPAHLLQGGLR